jgi:hypothetical protein
MSKALEFVARKSSRQLFPMRRVGCLLLAIAAIASGQSDPAFDDIPFGAWLRGGSGASVEWTLNVDAPVLTESQRLRASVVARIDGSEMVKRQPGELILFLEVRGKAAGVYRTHRALEPPPKGTTDVKLKVTEDVCVLPGEYQIAAAIYNTRSKKHSLRRAKLRVPELPHDPLPGIWRGLPALESIPMCDRSPLSIPLSTRQPVRVDLIVDTPIDVSTNIAAHLKVMSWMQVQNGLMTAIRLDLRNRTVDEERVARPFDEKSFLRIAPGATYTVDAAALAIDDAGEQFFLAEIRKRVELLTPNTEHVLVIFSDRIHAPRERGLLSTPAIPPATRVYYIRCSRPPRAFWGSDGSLVGSTSDATNVRIPGWRPTPLPTPPPPTREDSLEQTLTPLHPRVFDVATPMEFRKALAEILAQISH